MSGGPGCIPMFDRKGQVKCVMLCDYDDAVKYGSLRWADSGGRATRKTETGTVYFHRLVMGDPPFPKAEVDHIDGDGLNNQRSNLRWTTKFQNMQNLSRRGRSRVGYRGVDQVKAARAPRFRARVMIGRTVHDLGRFASPEEAARVVSDFRRANSPYSTERP